jgi:hypothetical protein
MPVVAAPVGGNLTFVGGGGVFLSTVLLVDTQAEGTLSCNVPYSSMLTNISIWNNTAGEWSLSNFCAKHTGTMPSSGGE